MFIIKIVVVQIFLFIAIIIVLRKIIFSDTNSALNRLNDARALTDKKNEELDKKVLDCEEECKRKIAASHDEAEKILKDARHQAEEDAKGVLAKARKEGDELLQKASDAKEKMREMLVKEMSLKTADFANDVLARVLPGNISERFNEFLAEDFIKQLTDIDSKHIGDDINKIEVISRYKLSDALKQKVQEILNGKLKRTLEVVEQVDPRVMAGVVFKFGTLILDGSLATKVKETAEQMKKEKEDA